MRYWLTPTVSVEAVHVMEIWDEDVAEALRFDGAVGGVLSTGGGGVPSAARAGCGWAYFE
jgi:hypothetical protein